MYRSKAFVKFEKKATRLNIYVGVLSDVKFGLCMLSGYLDPAEAIDHHVVSISCHTITPSTDMGFNL